VLQINSARAYAKTGAVAPDSVMDAVNALKIGDTEKASITLNRMPTSSSIDFAKAKFQDMTTGLRTRDIAELRTTNVDKTVIDKLIDLNQQKSIEELAAMDDTGKSIAFKAQMRDKLTSEELEWAMQDQEHMQKTADALWGTEEQRNLITEAKEAIQTDWEMGKITADEGLNKLDVLKNEKTPMYEKVIC
jgi:hypothetical protein